MRLRSLGDVLLAGLESAVASILSGGAELLLDLEQAVVLGNTLATSRSTGLDLAGVLCHSQVGDGGVRGLAGTVGNHGGEAVLGGQLDGVEGLGDGTDLVQLDQQGVGGAELDALSQTCRVGDQQVVADELQTIAELGGDGSPVFPAFFLERILNGDDRVLVDESPCCRTRRKPRRGRCRSACPARSRRRRWRP